MVQSSRQRAILKFQEELKLVIDRYIPYSTKPNVENVLSETGLGDSIKQLYGKYSNMHHTANPIIFYNVFCVAAVASAYLYVVPRYGN